MPLPDDTKAQTAVTAVGVMLVAGALVAGTTVLAKALGTGTLGPEIHPLQITFGRYLFAFLPILVFAALFRPGLTKPSPALHLARVLCAWAGVTLMFTASTLIPLSDATAISFLNPVIAMLLAIPFLGERIGHRRWIAAALSLIGALLLIRPGSSAFQPHALFALAAAVILGIEAIVVKKLLARESSFQILVVANGLGSLVAFLGALPVWVWPSPTQWLALAGVGVLMVSAQCMFLVAMRRGDVSFVLPLFYVTLIFAALYDLLFFGVVPGHLSLAGAAIILLGGGVMAWSELVRRRSLVSSARRP